MLFRSSAIASSRLALMAAAGTAQNNTRVRTLRGTSKRNGILQTRRVSHAAAAAPATCANASPHGCIRPHWHIQWTAKPSAAKATSVQWHQSCISDRSNTASRTPPKSAMPGPWPWLNMKLLPAAANKKANTAKTQRFLALQVMAFGAGYPRQLLMMDRKNIRNSNYLF